MEARTPRPRLPPVRPLASPASAASLNKVLVEVVVLLARKGLDASDDGLIVVVVIKKGFAVVTAASASEVAAV